MKSSFLLTFNIIVVVVVSSLTYSLWSLVGCILICFNVTACAVSEFHMC